MALSARCLRPRVSSSVARRPSAPTRITGLRRMNLRSAVGALQRVPTFVFTRNFHSSVTPNFARSSYLKATAAELYTKDAPMFCFQCEQTRDQKGCTTIGVCGKEPEVASMQDLMVHMMKGISQYAHRARKLGASDREIDRFFLASMFQTLTNVNFDPARHVEVLVEAERLLEKAKAMYEKACAEKGITPEKIEGPANTRLVSHTSVEELTKQGHEYGVLMRKHKFGEDVAGIQEMIVYGIKGACAYAEHAELLQKESDEIYAKFHEIFDFLATADDSVPMEKYLDVAMQVGQLNLKVMELLDAAHTEHFGHPEPTRVRATPVAGKCILVSGHDLHDLEMILQQTEGKGINVYTHGEMLPAHAYPGLKKYPHLKGNYGGAWQLQKIEFHNFPGPIVLTSNCLIEPRKSYKDRVFTRHNVGFAGVKHIKGNDFSEVVKMALELPGFTKDDREHYVNVGFGRHAVLSVADKVVEAVKSGQIKHFFVIGGCDGAEGERSYFRDFALNTPKDSVILTLACGKYRFNKYEFGEVAGLPRLMDMGQCNDAFSGIQIASALAKAFNTDVNGLPISFIISWFEQKAVAVLLTLLSLNIQNIHLGPNLPAFCTPNILKILQERFKIRGIGEAKQDVMAAMSTM